MSPFYLNYFLKQRFKTFRNGSINESLAVDELLINIYLFTYSSYEYFCEHFFQWKTLFAAEKDYLKMIGMLSRSILHTGQVSYTIFCKNFYTINKCKRYFAFQKFLNWLFIIEIPLMPWDTQCGIFLTKGR